MQPEIPRNMVKESFYPPVDGLNNHPLRSIEFDDRCEDSSGNWKDVPNMLARRSYCSASELEADGTAICWHRYIIL